MNVITTKLSGILIFEPRVFSDDRGVFMETWSKQRHADAGVAGDFVQDNISYSKKGVLRGLHFQSPHPQGKLVQALKGEVFDVAVDIRLGSATFGQWIGEVLSGENNRQMYVPPGFAHGFCVTSDEAVFSYKCTDYYNAPCEGGIRWDDPDIGIEWPVAEPLVSPKDEIFTRLCDFPKDKLPKMGEV
jgi:dTDP-4-dehydrorhamnose 3,5-epimerase